MAGHAAVPVGGHQGAELQRRYRDIFSERAHAAYAAPAGRWEPPSAGTGRRPNLLGRTAGKVRHLPGTQSRRRPVPAWNALVKR